MDGSQRLEASRDATSACLRCYCTHAVVTHAVHEAQPRCLIRGMQHLLREPQESKSPHHWELTLWEAAAYSWPVQQDRQRFWLEQECVCCPVVRHSSFTRSLKCSRVREVPNTWQRCHSADTFKKRVHLQLPDMAA